MFNRAQTHNVCLAAPGLAISVAGSATIKYGNTFSFKANSRVSTSITTATVATTTFVAATTNAPYPNGTASTAGVLATGYGRVYTLVAELPENSSSTATPTYSFLASSDFVSTTDMPILGYAVDPLKRNQTALGWVIVLNNSGSNFTPGTTALDASGVKVIYQDNYGIVGA